ncbi:response regulator [Azospirillum agricola]|uniref:response regulator n=1 Tax=Azospirillum agricola TaxID=1720247 RepID=UPI000A0EF326|nr:response regulator [Azospirillum agricola]SMH39425.1 Response regulator receiver domain-containing protein [Azospirillum lipoferum]
MRNEQQASTLPPTVLVVEDEPLVRMMTVTFIEDMGYRVIEAGSAEEALEHVRSEPAIDLLFTDIRMPGLDGFALAERARTLRPAIKVIYATGYAELERTAAPNALGPLLSKPYAPDRLDEEIRKSLEG